MKWTSRWHITKKLQESFRSSEVVAILLPTSPWAPSPVNWRVGAVLMMNSLCSGKAGKGARFSVNSFADNIAAQIDPIRWAALYLSGSSGRGGYGGGRPTCRTPSCTAAFRGDGSPQRSAKQLLVRQIPFPYEASCCACVSARGAAGLLGSERQQLPATAVPRPPVPPPSEGGCADTDSRLLLPRFFPSRLKLIRSFSG